jgi:hypothetical protein
MPCGDGSFTGPKMSEDIFMRGRGGFAQANVLRGVAVAFFNRHESEKTIFSKLCVVGEVGTPLVCSA